MRLGGAAVPVRHGGKKLHVAAERLHAVVIGIINGAVTSEDVDRLTHQQPQISQIQRDVLETEERPRFGSVSFQDVGADAEGGERHTALDAAIQLHELEVHIDGIGELRLAFLDRAQRRRFP